LNSTPQLLARDRRAVAQGAQLGPGDLRMHSPAETAVGAGDNVFSADDVGESDDAIRYQFRVLDEVGGMADDTGDQEFSGGKFHVAPDLELSQEKTPDPFSTRLIIDLLCTVGEKQDRILFSFRYKIIEALPLQLVK
jgi:hypothetical protein